MSNQRNLVVLVVVGLWVVGAVVVTATVSPLYGGLMLALVGSAESAVSLGDRFGNRGHSR